MKFLALVEYDYPVEHKPPVKAELVLHGDRVETENIKIIAVEMDKTGHWIFENDGVSPWVRCSVCGDERGAKTNFCPSCGAFMVNGGDEE